MRKLADGLSRQLIRHYRGRRSAASFSQHLGFRSNKVIRWESGHAEIRWDELVFVTQKIKEPVSKNLAKNAMFPGKSLDFSAIREHFFANLSQKQIAQTLKISETTVSKYMSGKISPPADDVFYLLSQRSPFSYLKFVEAFAPPEMLGDEMKKFSHKEAESTSLITRTPWMMGLLLVLNTTAGGREKEQIISELAITLGFSKPYFESVIGDLLQDKALLWNEKEKKFEVQLGQFTDFTSHPEALMRTIKFWNTFIEREALQRPPRDQNRSHFITVSLRPEKVAEMQKLCIQFMHDVLSLDDDAPTAEVFAFSLQFADLRSTFFGELARKSGEF